MPTMTMPVAAALAAIVYAEKNTDVDALLADFVSEQLRSGRRLGGLLQTHRVGPNGKKSRYCVDLQTGQLFSLSQDLGSQSQSCSLDASGVAQAGQVLRQALAERVDLAVINRFGELESAGGGFAAEILALVDAGIPVLTAVAQRHLAAWRQFAGHYGEELVPQRVALNGWWGRCAPHASADSNTTGRPQP